MSKKNNQKEKMAPRAIVKIVILISIIALIIILPCVYSGITYINAYNSNKHTPFAPTETTNDDGTKSETEKISGVVIDENTKRMDAKDFKLFDITFKCTYYNDREDEKGTDIQTVKYSLKVTKNLDSPSSISPISTSSTYYLKAGLCLTADWIDLESYSSSLTSFAFDSEKSFSISCKKQFPAKASTWPFPVVVDSPDCYLYLFYNTQENGKTVQNTYILKYTYQEYITATTDGGIRK